MVPPAVEMADSSRDALIRPKTELVNAPENAARR